MKKLLVLLVLLWATVLHAQITYWWSQMLKKPDAKQSQEYFFVPGTNIYFTYATNRVIINGSGTNVTIATSTNSLYALYATNWIGSTNALTNLSYTYITNPPWQWGCGNLSNWCLVETNVLTNIVAGGQTNIYSTNLIDYYTMLQAGTNILITTNAGYLVVNWTPTNVVTPPDYISNLIAWWKMDAGSGSTAIDSSGHNNTGTLTNSPSWITGHIGPFALQFKSNSFQGVYALTLTNLSPYTNMTVTWWQYHTNAWNSGLQRVMWEETYPYGVIYSFSAQVYTDNIWYLGWYRGDPPGPNDMRLKFPANVANWPQNQWIHYAYVSSSTGQKFYTNGVLCASTNLPPNPVMAVGNFPFCFGMFPEISPLFFDGAMDDFRIYSTNLTDTEIQGVYGYNGLLDLYVLRSGDTMSGGLTNISGWLTIQGDPKATLALEVTNVFGPSGYLDSLIQLNTNQLLSISSQSNFLKGPTYLGQGIYGDGSGLTNLPCCTNGAFSGSFTGDGSGLTNIPFTAISGLTNYSFTFQDTVTSNAIVMSFYAGQIIYNDTGTNAPAAPVTLALLDIATSKPVTISFVNGQITYNFQ